jgi:hypothetical protein
VFGAVDVEGIAEAAKRDVASLLASASFSVSNAETICVATTQRNVFSAGQKLAAAASYPLFIRERLASAFAADKLLETISPKAWRMIRDEAGKSLGNDMFFVCSVRDWYSRISRLAQRGPPSLDANVFLCLVKKRMDELHQGQLELFRMFLDQEKEKERYNDLYTREKEKRIELERHLLVTSNVQFMHFPEFAQS